MNSVHLDIMHMIGKLNELNYRVNLVLKNISLIYNSIRVLEYSQYNSIRVLTQLSTYYKCIYLPSTSQSWAVPTHSHTFFQMWSKPRCCQTTETMRTRTFRHLSLGRKHTKNISSFLDYNFFKVMRSKLY